MNPTHRARNGNSPVPELVRAWRFDPVADIPLWVVRRFHNVNNVRGEWSGLVNGELVEARTGDWAVCKLSPGNGVILNVTVLSDTGFKAAYEAVEVAA